MDVLERYFDALRTHNWSALSDCLSEDVSRMGPYLDAIAGRDEYVAYLARVVPTLQNYDLRVTRIEKLEGGSRLVRLCEILDVHGESTEFPEALVFDFDSAGLISHVDIYIKQPPTSG